MTDPLPSLVFPVIVEGTIIAHLAAPELDVAGAGYRVICPGGPLITSALRRAEPHDTFIWCNNCKDWAKAAGLTLPSSRRTQSA